MSAPRPPSRLPPALALGALLCASCDPPPVEPTADYRQSQNLSRIEGEVVVQGRVRGNAILFLYDATRPPPPQGTGRPVSFTVIPQERLFGAADPAAAGPFTAPYTFSLVASGRYLVRGFIDANTCLPPPQPCHVSDFIPWFGVTSEPNTGDMGGAAVDPLTRVPRVVDITTAKPDGTLPSPTGVNVLFGDTLTVPLDRPAFFVDSPSRFERGASVKQLELKNLQVREGAVDQRPAALLVRLVDDDGDGKPDDANNDGLPDLWPRVVVRKLAEGASLSDVQRLADENDLDRNGVPDIQGVEYPRADGTVDGQPDVVILGAALDPSVYDVLRKPDGTWRMEAVPVASLRVNVQARALDARPSPPQALRAVPSGRYALTLIQFTGQTWRVPNELSAPVAAAAGLPEVKSQAFFLEVP